jgi:16S rRNA (adenine1518-N6/adenine1519-N6)-dimethyltransferase
LIDRELRKRIVDYACLDKCDVVLEVGPGDGGLTSLLAQNSRKVIAVEKDPRLARLLNYKFDGQHTVKIIEGDVLRLQLPKFNKIVSNLPYYISSKFMLFLTKKTFEIAILTLQKEFVEKLIAKSGTSSYGRITVVVQHKMEVNVLDEIPREFFYPKPKVDSAIVRLSPKNNLNKHFDQPLFEDVVRALFTQRKKKACKALAHFLRLKTGCSDKALIDEVNPPNSRVCEMTVEEFEELSHRVSLALESRTCNF